jgi:hypothetical protein
MFSPHVHAMCTVYCILSTRDDVKVKQIQGNSCHHSARNLLSALLHKASELNAENFNYSPYFMWM